MDYLKKYLKNAYHVLSWGLFCTRANYFLKKISKRRIKSVDEKIRVAFMVQMPEIWDKEAPIFEAMTLDDRFAPYLVVIPSYDFANTKIGEYGSELKYFQEKYHEKYIIKAYESDWIDLKSLEFDYIFYQRCWENYLPEQFHTKNVIKYARTCYVPYFAAGLNDGVNYYKTSFFANLYICFCSTEEQILFHPKNRNRKIIFCGSPVLEQFTKITKSEKKAEQKKVLWTPRWSDDIYYGGSTFFENMYNILNIKKMYQDVDLVLRPHPLTFENAVKERKLSEKEVLDYKNEVTNIGAVFDTNTFIADTLVSTDILITDYSSIIIEYFITGRPVIYCSDINLNFEEIYRKISRGFYIANKWDDVQYYVNEILQGNDTKYADRHKIACEIVEKNKDATRHIIEFISDDFRGY